MIINKLPPHNYASQTSADECCNRKVRLDYLDCLRGTSMILVVFYHILFLCVHLPDKECVIDPLFSSFRMPLFFFVSGYFAYKPINSWTNSYARDILKRKFQAQIIGTIFFSSIFFLLINDPDPLRAFKLDVGGYWFTLTLFRIFLLYAIISLALRKSSTKIRDLVLLVVSIIGAVLFITKPINNVFFTILGYNTLYFLQFFFLGACLKKYGDSFFKPIISNAGLITITLGFIFSNICIYHFEDLIKDKAGLYSFLVLRDEIARYFGLLLVFSLFFINKHKFSGSSKFIKSLRFIGRRTLDIYFIHFFFLPDLSFLKPFLLGEPNSIASQVLVGVIYTAVVISLSLGVSYILRLSPSLSQWLFGVKKAVISNN